MKLWERLLMRVEIDSFFSTSRQTFANYGFLNQCEISKNLIRSQFHTELKFIKRKLVWEAMKLKREDQSFNTA